MISTLRITSVFLLSAAFVFTISSILIDNRDSVSVGENETDWKTVSGNAAESPSMLEYNFIQRLYGNPDANIQNRLWSEYRRIAYTPQSALMKPFDIANNWKLEGPDNISGRVRAVVFDPSDPNTLYVGTASGGVWKSTDLGRTWIPLTDDQPTMNVSALAIDRNNPDKIFAGTGEPIMGSTGRKNGSPFYDGIGVLRSDNAGQTWTVLPWPSQKSSMHRLALHPVSSDTLLEASRDKLWKSTDAGQSWNSVLTGIITDVIYNPGDPSTVFAAVGYDFGGASNGVYVSHAGGNKFTFSRLTENFPPGDSCGRIVLAISDARPEKLYAAVAANRRILSDPQADFNVLMVSENSGESWQRKDGAINRTFTRGQAFYDFCVGVAPDDPDLVFLGGIDTYRSTNGGNGFSQQSRWEYRQIDPNNPAYVHADQHHIAFQPGNSQTIVFGNDGGIFLTTNAGGTWEERTNGLATVQYYAITYAPSQSTSLYGGTQDNSSMRQSTVGQAKWYFVGGGDGGNIAVDPLNHNFMYLCINSTPYRTPNGTTFQPLVNGLEGTRFNWIRPMLLPPGEQSPLYTASQYVHVLKPAMTGTAWRTVSPALSASSIVTDIAIPEQSFRMMYAVTGDGKAYVSWDALALDPEWDDISDGLPNRWFSDVSPGWEDNELAYISASGFGTGHAFKTTDAGLSWTDISGDLPDIPANAILPSRHDDNTVFLATDLGVWYTINGGVNWKQFGNGLPNVVAYDMRLTPENRLLVGTYGRGYWSTNAIVSTGTPVAAPSDLTLAQNHPNPFGPLSGNSTSISYSLRNETMVRLAVYDATGRHVRTLVDGRVGPGEHNATMQASDLPAGSYFIVLESGQKRLTKRMLLLR